jgi:hypothetical protein
MAEECHRKRAKEKRVRDRVERGALRHVCRSRTVVRLEETLVHSKREALAVVYGCVRRTIHPCEETVSFVPDATRKKSA